MEQGKCTCTCLCMFWPRDLVTRFADPAHVQTRQQRWPAQRPQVPSQGRQKNFQIHGSFASLFSLCASSTSLLQCSATPRNSHTGDHVSFTDKTVRQGHSQPKPMGAEFMTFSGNGFGAHFLPCKLP